MQEDLVAIREVKSFVRQEYEKQRFNTYANTLQKAQVYAEKMFSFAGPIQMLVMWSCTIILLAIGGHRVMVVGDIHAGALTSLISYTSQIVGSLAMLSFISISIGMARVSFGRGIAEGNVIKHDAAVFHFQLGLRSLNIRDLSPGAGGGSLQGRLRP